MPDAFDTYNFTEALRAERNEGRTHAPGATNGKLMTMLILSAERSQKNARCFMNDMRFGNRILSNKQLMISILCNTCLIDMLSDMISLG